MAHHVVSYAPDDETVVRCEIEPTSEFHQVGAGEVAGQVREAVRPAVEAARTVLDQAVALRPAEVQVTFGAEVTGTANWPVAMASTDADCEVSLVWRPAAADGA